MGTVHLIPSSDSEAISFFQAQSTFTELLPSARHSLGRALGGGVGRAEPEETKENQSLLLRNLRFTKEDNFNHMACEGYSGRPQKEYSTEPRRGGGEGG